MKLNLAVIVLGSCIILSQQTTHTKPYAQCTCADKSQCNLIQSWNADETEVMITTNGLSDYKQWLWDSITSVMILNDGWKMDLMCYTHAKGKKFGFFVDIPDTFDNTSIDEFIHTTKLDIDLHYADIIALDALKILGKCDYASQHVDALSEVIKKIVNGLTRPKLKILLVMPWKPPCYENNCGLAPTVAGLVDGIITSPESFRTYCDMSCRAEATIPYSKLLLGLQEYVSAGFTQQQILMGIPWHGYNYTCDSHKEVEGKSNAFICNLKKNATTKQCDVDDSRSRFILGQYYMDHRDWVFTAESNYSKMDQAPFHQAKDSDDVLHMSWYEDVGSLTTKYQVVMMYKLKGLVIYTGDDLTSGKVEIATRFNTNMWSWLLHAVLVTGDATVTKPNMSIAGTVAGVGCGMFVLGCVLGAIFACMIFHRKKKLRMPFRKDIMQEEFRDEDPNL